MTHGSLFSGIGGFDLASEWMGWENVFHCEYDPFCQKVLKHHFPNSKLYDDVTTFDATTYAGRIDILTGGFPCQPFSAAGKRLGTEDERHLWPQMLRIIREISPRYVVGENVSGLLNWSGGLVFEEVCADLETEGYEVTPYILPACGKNAPHRRDRIWFIANSTKRNGGRNTRSVPSKEEEERICERNEIPKSTMSSEVFGDASDTINERLEGKCRSDRELEGGFRPECTNSQANESNTWENFPTVPPICGGDDGLPKELDGITFPKWRKESVKAYGNAIVPQVAHEIFKAIQKMEDQYEEAELEEELNVITQAH